MNKKFVLVIHGGAGTILKSKMTPLLEEEYRKGLEDALSAGLKVLKGDGTALDAVAEAVRSMEDNVRFNAGKGSVFTHDETHEMDASIMEGKERKAGAVAGLTCIKNPIIAALKVMQNTRHVMLMGPAAEKFAQSQGCEVCDPSYFYSDLRWNQIQKVKNQDIAVIDHNITIEKDKIKPQKEDQNQETQHQSQVDPDLQGGKDQKYSTVGAVALDIHGNIAAATSTGGLTNKRFGRVGDSPIIGAGTYANNKTCAVSCTGEGEKFIRAVAAYDVSALMEYKGWDLDKAANYVIHERIKALQTEGGLIAVDANGNITMPLSSPGMYRGFVREDEKLNVFIYDK